MSEFGTAELSNNAYRTVLDNDGALHAARAAAVGGDVAREDELSERDREMLEVGAFAGAATAIARAENPYQSHGVSLECVDDVMLGLLETRAKERHAQEKGSHREVAV